MEPVVVSGAWPVEGAAFTFKLGQRVIVRDANIAADIVAQINTAKGVMYEIVFWTLQGQRVTTVVFERELRAKE